MFASVVTGVAVCAVENSQVLGIFAHIMQHTLMPDKEV